MHSAVSNKREHAQRRCSLGNTLAVSSVKDEFVTVNVLESQSRATPPSCVRKCIQRTIDEESGLSQYRGHCRCVTSTALFPVKFECVAVKVFELATYATPPTFAEFDVKKQERASKLLEVRK